MKDKELIKHFSKMNPTKQLELLKQLENHIGSETKIISNAPKRGKCCHCKSENIIKFGFYSGKRRYRCKDCGKTFSEFTGTSVYNIKKKHVWIPFIKLTLENKSIRYIAKQLPISHRTAFLWRHKLLNSLNEIFVKEFKGIVEMDDIYIPFNQKGRRNDFVGKKRRDYRYENKKRGISDQQLSIMVMTDRYYCLDMKTIRMGRFDATDLNRTVNLNRLNDDNIICSDTHRSIESFVKSLNLKHVQIKAFAKEYVKDGIYHVQKVNGLASKFKRWLNGNFINVATKYMQNYLSLFQVAQILNPDELERMLTYSLLDDKTYIRNKNVEIDYQRFLAV